MASIERITVIGSGYVGLTTGVCLASLGHCVTCVDHDPAMVAELREGRTVLAEPELSFLLRDALDNDTISFESSVEATVPDSHIVFLCLPTPSCEDGAADLTAIAHTVTQICHLLRSDTVLVTKSTVPVGTSKKISTWLDREDIAVVSNPEFLREGHAVYDFLHPIRILIGCDDPAAAKRITGLYDAVRTEVIITDPATAELAKYAANCFLATKLSYINTVAELCETLGADITDLSHILGADPRIGDDFLRSGPGWGGPCLPKDTRALSWQAKRAGVEFPVLEAAIISNTYRQDRVVSQLRDELGPLDHVRIGLLGLAFKTGTNDLRDSPAIRIARTLAGSGATVTAHDPTVDHEIPGLTVEPDVYDIAPGTQALVLTTDWPEYRHLNWDRIAGLMIGNLVLDTRNILDARHLRAAGLRCVRLGQHQGPKQESECNDVNP